MVALPRAEHDEISFACRSFSTSRLRRKHRPMPVEIVDRIAAVRHDRIHEAVGGRDRCRRRVHELRLHCFPLPRIALPRLGGQRPQGEVLAPLTPRRELGFGLSLVPDSPLVRSYSAQNPPATNASVARPTPATSQPPRQPRPRRSLPPIPILASLLFAQLSIPTRQDARLGHSPASPRETCRSSVRNSCVCAERLRTLTWHGQTKRRHRRIECLGHILSAAALRS